MQQNSSDALPAVDMATCLLISFFRHTGHSSLPFLGTKISSVREGINTYISPGTVQTRHSVSPSRLDHDCQHYPTVSIHSRRIFVSCCSSPHVQRRKSDTGTRQEKKKQCSCRQLNPQHSAPDQLYMHLINFDQRGASQMSPHKKRGGTSK